MAFFECFAWFYLTILTVHFINSFISAFFNVQFVQHVYIACLERLFSYAASVVASEAPHLQYIKGCESVENLETYDEELIKRDVQLTGDGVVFDEQLVSGEHRGFTLHHPLYLVKCGVEAIIEDSVTKRFSAAELRVWNFLGRNQNYVYMKTDKVGVLNLLWLIGFFVRYTIFFPCRLFTFSLSVPLTWIVGYAAHNFPAILIRKWLHDNGLQTAIRLNLSPFSSVIRFHDMHNRPKPNTICVANHTTPFDWCVLASDVTYAVVGQQHSGFFGLVEKIISAAVPAVWFDRDEVLDRQRTASRLKEHVSCLNAEPLLIFPEGTCINNTSVMKFKKGCFEVGAPIHPVAIKYNPLFADCFWNSSRDGLLQYTFKMMSSWAMVVDVWYLPPTRMRDDEDGIMFARRVQQSIANCGGLLNMDWDGELKRRRPKDTMKLEQQRIISQYLVPQEKDQSATQ